MPSSSVRTLSSHNGSSTRTGTAAQPSAQDADNDDFELDLIRESDIADLGRFSDSDEEEVLQDTIPENNNASEEMDDLFENDDYNIDDDLLLELAAMEDKEEKEDISQLTQAAGDHELAAGPSTGLVDVPVCGTSIVKQEVDLLSSAADGVTLLQMASVVGKPEYWRDHPGSAYIKVWWLDYLVCDYTAFSSYANLL